MARKSLDLQLIERLARIGCTDREIALICGCGEATIQRRGREALDRGRANLRKSLRRKQLELARKGNVPMLIWLGKQYLDQRDRQDVNHSGEAITVTERIITDRLDPAPG